jgi:phage tail-like protein
MAVRRERPYSVFNFLVTIDGGSSPDAVEAGFQEVGGLGMEITVQEYRPGNYPINSPMKVTGVHKVTDISLKRGVIGTLDLFSWLKEVRDGSQSSRRRVVIELQNEDHTATVMTWTLAEARPIKYTGPAFNGKGTDVAIEELVLAVEAVDIE